MKINREHVVGLVCIGIGVAVLLITPSFPAGQESVNLTGPAFFPNILAYIYLALGIVQLYMGYKNQGVAGEKSDASAAKAGPIWLVLEFIGLLVGFLLLFQPLGFIVCTLIFLFLLLVLLGVPALRSVLYSFVFTGAIYLLFGKLFTIGLPVGILSFIGM